MYKKEKRESEHGIKSLFEEIMMENFLNLAKEKDIHVQEAQKVSNKMIPKRPMPGHIRIKVAKVKDKEKLLRAVREKPLLRGNSNKTVSLFHNGNTSGQKGLAENF